MGRGLGLRAAAEAWGMGPLTALHYTAVLRSVELCSAVLLTKTLKTPSPPVMNFWVGSNAKNPFPGGIFQQ